jgi:hypothetical protein
VQGEKLFYCGILAEDNEPVAPDSGFRVSLCRHLPRPFATNENNDETSTEGGRQMNKLVTMMRLTARILAAILTVNGESNRIKQSMSKKKKQ